MRKQCIEGKIVDVVAKTIFSGVITIENDKITSIQHKDDVPDCYILPGFVNAHVHIESTMLVPSEYARIAVQHGSVASICDPHEIANVLGIDGVLFMINNASNSPLKLFFGAPSCVPATEFETSGYQISVNDIDALFAKGSVHFLSEMMNYPGVIYDDKQVVAKIDVSKKYKKPIDGHAPELQGEMLKKYVEAGISTDHECTSIDEAIAKIELGMKVLIREGSAAKNLEALYPLIDRFPNNIMLCTDDSHPDDLLRGHINLIVKQAISKGVDLFNLLRAVSLNPIQHYNLPVGLLQVNDPADFIIVDNLTNFAIQSTYINGKAVFQNKKVNFNFAEVLPFNNFVRESIVLDSIRISDCNQKIKVIDASDGDLLTKISIANPKVENGFIVSDCENDVLKIVVVNRYSKTVAPTIGFIRNFGLKRGAIASSIAHDSHNVIAIGATDADLLNAINCVIQNKGGLAVCNGNEVYDLKLEIAGLMSTESIEKVAAAYQKIQQKAIDLGSPLTAPFMTLSFMALLVIPELKIGDRSLFDGIAFQPTSLFV